MSRKSTRIAIVNSDKCKPDKCNKECKSFCPVEKQGKECINIMSDIEDIPLNVKDINTMTTKRRKYAKIIESACTACGICTKKCPFDAIKMVNIPNEINGTIIHRYTENGFRLYKIPIMKSYQVVGILGRNGIGKSTILQLITNKMKPNFEEFKKIYTDQEIVNMFKGTEMHKFMDKLYKGGFRVSIKPQHVESLVKYLALKDKNPSIEEYLDDIIKSNKNLNFVNEVWIDKVICKLELNQILKSKIKTLSGGELQRVVCASTLLKEADLYVFDEPSNYLDIKQRLNIAELIQDMILPDKYIIVIEHDLALLDYMSDSICIMYGEPGAFGVISKPHSTAEAINMYFDGYIPSENMRFRTEEYNIKDLKEMDDEIEEVKGTISYNGSFVKFNKFELEIKEGTFPTNSSITVILGENGTGKTTFINYLAKELGSSVSYKPQYLSIEKFYNDKLKSYPTVEQLFYNSIRDKYFDEQFRTDVVKPMQINLIKDRTLDQLSGGELQRTWIVYCLGQNAHIYLLDEPSACLDVEQRVTTTKVIKRYIMHNQKIGFVVEHDMMMGVSLAQETNSQIIVMDKSYDSVNEIRRCVANKPTNFSDGINRFLKSLNITFRTESNYSKHARPRINKRGSVRDRDQKLSGKYYL